MLTGTSFSGWFVRFASSVPFAIQPLSDDTFTSNGESASTGSSFDFGVSAAVAEVPGPSKSTAKLLNRVRDFFSIFMVSWLGLEVWGLGGGAD